MHLPTGKLFVHLTSNHSVSHFLHTNIFFFSNVLHAKVVINEGCECPISKQGWTNRSGENVPGMIYEGMTKVLENF